MSVSCNGIGEVIVTFELGANIMPGAAVSVSKEGTVINAASNTKFLGIARSVSEDHCAVQIGGYTEAQYGGTKPPFGNAILASNGSNGVKVHTDGRNVHVVSVNEDEGIVGFFYI